MFALDQVRELSQLASTIADPEARAGWNERISAYAERLPRQYRRNECVACGDTDLIRAGQICKSCFADLIKAEVARGREDDGEGEALSVSNRDHWNNVKRLTGYKSAPPDAPFMSNIPDKDRLHISPQSVFQKLMTRLAVLCLEAFPAAGQRNTKPLLGSRDAGADRITGIAPTGFTEAIRELEDFIVWAELAAYQDGFEKGHNLLTGLASGTMTNEGFTQEVFKANERLTKRMIEAETSGTDRTR